jgi:hypothetical protein
MIVTYEMHTRFLQPLRLGFVPGEQAMMTAPSRRQSANRRAGTTGALSVVEG